MVTMQIVLDKGNSNDWFGSAWIVQLTVVSALSFIAFISWHKTYKPFDKYEIILEGKEDSLKIPFDSEKFIAPIEKIY